MMGISKIDSKNFEIKIDRNNEGYKEFKGIWEII
jgi:hypothetical protein